MKQIKSVAVLLIIALSVTFVTPAVPAYAFSLNDILTSSSSSGSGSGNSFMNILLGLLLGKFLSNIGGTSTSASDNSLPAGLTPASGSSSATANGQAIVNTAKKYMGVPYVWGGDQPTGWDCSGFTQYVMRQNGITLPRTAAEQYAVGTPVDKNDLLPGDLVFFTTYKPGASHVGFYIGGGKFIHASSAAGKVTISSLDEKYYSDHYIGSRRYIH
ncbi:Hypothetical protein LUCI_3513 [Lucifera butyrica]|uniref:NlpC/P60 domain-containing protein n=1 Tax=Lucifera butyrica TaxID=1351585 RepID=A0A498R9N1_9FIRM|nr:C40 family peptidase [Lucifera butyrica]VBB08244.1 Hypothetical protein LUCI_3513 [Lucifera butyrica]